MYDALWLLFHAAACVSRHKELNKIKTDGIFPLPELQIGATQQLAPVCNF